MLKRRLLDQVRWLQLLPAVRRVWRILRPRDRQIWLLLVALGAGVAILEAITAGAALLLVQQLTHGARETATASGALESLRLQLAPGLDPLSFAALGFLSAFTITTAATVASLYIEGRLSTRIYLWAGVDLLGTYLRADYAWIKQQNSAEFMRNIQESANMFATNVVLPAGRIVRETTVFLAVSVTALLARPELASLTLLLAGLYALVHWVPYRISERLGRQSETVKRDQQQALLETFDLFAEIRINGLFATYMERFAKPRRAYRRILLMRQLNEMLPARAAEWLVLAMIIGFIVALGPSLRAGPAGDYWMQTLIFALYLAIRLRTTLTSLLGNIMILRFGWASFLNVEKGLHDTPAGFDETSKQPLPFATSIRFENVAYLYPNSDAGLAGLDVEIRLGEWIGIAGRSGAGKTTFSAILMGLLRPQSGRTLVDGVPQQLAQVAWFANIGFVSQSFALIDDSLRANITLAAGEGIDNARLAHAIKVARLERIIAEIPGGLDGRVGENGGLLSGGQRQRVALARALYRDAKILILDEATSALDAETEAEILRDLQGLRGRITLIAIAHRPSVLDLCDRVLTFEAGRLVDERRVGSPR